MGLTPEERVWRALNHEEADRIPLYEGITGKRFPKIEYLKKKYIHFKKLVWIATEYIRP